MAESQYLDPDRLPREIADLVRQGKGSGVGFLADGRIQLFELKRAIPHHYDNIGKAIRSRRHTIDKYGRELTVLLKMSGHIQRCRGCLVRWSNERHHRAIIERDMDDAFDRLINSIDESKKLALSLMSDARGIEDIRARENPATTANRLTQFLAAVNARLARQRSTVKRVSRQYQLLRKIDEWHRQYCSSIAKGIAQHLPPSPLPLPEDTAERLKFVNGLLVLPVEQLFALPYFRVKIQGLGYLKRAARQLDRNKVRAARRSLLEVGRLCRITLK